jgi:hypothetical protein
MSVRMTITSRAMAAVCILTGVCWGHGFQIQPIERVATNAKSVLRIRVVSVREWKTEKKRPDGKVYSHGTHREVKAKVTATIEGPAVKPGVELTLKRDLVLPARDEKGYVAPPGAEGMAVPTWTSIPPWPARLHKGLEYILVLSSPLALENGKVKHDIRPSGVLRLDQETALLLQLQRRRRMEVLLRAINKSALFALSWKRNNSVSGAYFNPWRLREGGNLFTYVLPLPRDTSSKGDGAWPSAQLKILPANYLLFPPAPATPGNPGMSYRQHQKLRPMVCTYFGDPVILVTQDLTQAQEAALREKLPQLRKIIQAAEKTASTNQDKVFWPANILDSQARAKLMGYSIDPTPADRFVFWSSRIDSWPRTKGKSLALKKLEKNKGVLSAFRGITQMDGDSWQVDVCVYTGRAKAAMHLGSLEIKTSTRGKKGLSCKDPVSGRLEPIGDLSVGHFYNGGKPWQSYWRGGKCPPVSFVSFVRGNVFVRISPIGGQEEQMATKDPLKLALKMDAFLKRTPGRSASSRKVRSVSLMVSDPKDATRTPAKTIVIGRPYVLTLGEGLPLPVFRKTADGRNDSPNLQLSASFADISLRDDGLYEITFFRPGKQIISCSYRQKNSDIHRFGGLIVPVQPTSDNP